MPSTKTSPVAWSSVTRDRRRGGAGVGRNLRGAVEVHVVGGDRDRSAARAPRRDAAGPAAATAGATPVVPAEPVVPPLPVTTTLRRRRRRMT